MARPVFSAKALGLSKVLCSMDTISSYRDEVVLVGKWVSGIGGNAGCFGKRTGGGVGNLFGFLLGVEPQNPLKRELNVYIFGELWLESWEIHNILPCHTLI